MQIAYGRQSIVPGDIAAVVAALKSDWLTQGPTLIKFEEALASYCGAKYAVAVSNGTAALHLAYLVAGLKRGNEVISTPNTFVATTNMLLAVGAKPVFCDIRPDTCNLDETKIEKLITKKTKAIVPVHFAGQPCDLSVIQKIAKRHRLLVIEDACHALGASYKKSKIGGCRYSDMTVFSFHPVKSITTGEGGAILTNNKDFYERLKLLRSHGVQKNSAGKNVMTALGYNYRLTDIQAALGLSQLKRLDSFISKRHQLVKLYEKQLKSVSNLILPVELSGLYSSWHLYAVRVTEAKYRQPLYNFLFNHGIGVNFHYPAVHKQPYYIAHGYRGVHCGEDELYADTMITLPLHISLTASDIKYICDKIKLFFKS